MTPPCVLFVAPTVSIWGGVQTWLDQTARSLRAAGWRVVAGLVRGPRFHDAAAYAAAHADLEAVEVPCFTGTAEGRAQAVGRVLRRVRPAVLVVVNVGDVLEGARRWKSTGMGAGCRVVFTVHGFSAPQLAELGCNAGTVDRVVTTNRLAQRTVREVCGFEPERVGYAPYGAEAPLPAPAPPTVETLRLAWVGRVEEPQKRVSDLVRVLEQCAERALNVQCDVVGDGPEMPVLRERLSSLVSTGRVRLLGRRSREDLYRSVYPGLDVLLLTSSWETGPIVAWEAMRNGATLVSTRYRGLTEEGALEDGVNCLLSDVGDSDGLAKHVASLARDRALLDRLAAAGRRMAGERYSIEASGQAWRRELELAMVAEPLPSIPAPPRPPAGRLDRLVGRRWAETARRVGGRRVEAREEADEWAHASASPERTLAMREALEARGLWFPQVPG